MNTPSDEVENFYDEFLEKRMIQYRLHGNLRLKMAFDFIRPFVCDDSRVLDLGCGIGIVTEKIASRAVSGKVYGCDISRRNIWYAQKTIKKKNLAFLHLDLIEEFDRLAVETGGNFDLITLIDVFEHIPKEGHARLLGLLTSLLKPEGFILMTFPSPGYQQYLRDRNPEELQIIDEDIDEDVIKNAAQDTGLKIMYYGLKNVWMTNQYIHCALTRNLKPVMLNSKKTLLCSIYERLVFYCKIPILVYRRKKYIDNIFKKKNKNPEPS